jgi:outer membrane immunogenic protein
MRELPGAASTLVTFAIAMIAAAPAGAADMAVPPYQPPPPVPIVWSWTGATIGIHGGGAWGNKDWDLTSVQVGGLSTTAFNSTGAHTVNGFVGGGQFGANYQTGHVVVGLEASFSWGGVKGHGDCFPALFPGTPSTCESNARWLGTLAGRIGGTIDRALLYVTGGAAFAGDEYTFSNANSLGGGGAAIVAPVTVKDARLGWMVGAGAEYAFSPNWSAKIEYNYLDFGTRHYQFFSPTTAGLALSSAYDVDITQRVHLVKIGLNYRFTLGGPVVAKY